jgi:hypothetical protein
MRHHLVSLAAVLWLAACGGDAPSPCAASDRCATADLGPSAEPDLAPRVCTVEVDHLDDGCVLAP